MINVNSNVTAITIKVKRYDASVKRQGCETEF